jgi:DNA processing protein
VNEKIKFYYSYPDFYTPVYKHNLLSRHNSLAALHAFMVQLFSGKELAELQAKTEKNFLDSQKLRIQSVDYFDPLYPKLLKEIHQPPIVLYYLGNPDLLNLTYFGIVGTRKPSKISIIATSLLAKKISKTPNHGIISGLASGIDREAMLSAIDLKIPCIGVLGTGLEKEYPRGNIDLYRKMKNNSKCLLISEMRVGEVIGKWSFPKRNRIITGISEALFLMEAPLKSGAMSSVYHALEQGREIVVFDDEALFFNEGGKKIIQDGAKKISMKEISDTNHFFHISELISEANTMNETPSLFAKLNQLEQEGYLENLGGGYYKKKLFSVSGDD